MRKKTDEANNNIRVLIVDDEPGIIDSLSILLKRSGYYYEGVTNPLEAVEKAKTGNFDLMIRII